MEVNIIRNKWFIYTVILLLVVSSFELAGKNKDDNDDDAIEQEHFSYKPVIGGTIRAKFEYEPQISSYRFQVRNARVSLKGWVAPFIDYKAEIDLCDRGEIKVLDVYGRLHIKKTFAFSLGQMRVPFSVEASRSPHMLFFANRSFVAKQVGNVRDVGLKIAYTPQEIPMVIEGGIYNGSGLTNQMKWHKKPSFSGKINYKLNDFKFEIGGQSILPDSIRINLFDTSLSWSNNRWFVEGEYIYKHYTNNSFPSVNAYNFFVNYRMPINWYFNWLSFGARFDGMDDHSNGIKTDEGILSINDYARKRITVGSTLHYINKVKAEIRLNYEKYFYSDDVTPQESEQDKIVLELMVNF